MRRLAAALAGILLLALPTASPADEFRFTERSNYQSTLAFSSAATPRPLLLRAGSGTVTDECAVNFGWLPRGAYDVQAHDTGLEGRVAGYAWELSDHQCYDGTFRTQLLIHSEMSSDGGQDDYWEPNRWTSADPDDYASFGCIKLSYQDILALESVYEEAEALGAPVRLVVE